MFFLKKNSYYKINKSIFFKRKKIKAKNSYIYILMSKQTLLKQTPAIKFSGSGVLVKTVGQKIEQKNVLTLKRKIGAIKYKYNKLKTNLFKGNFFLDLKRYQWTKTNTLLTDRNKHVHKKKFWRYRYFSISRKTFTKVSQKEARNIISSKINYNMIRQKKKTKVFYSIYKYTPSYTEVIFNRVSDVLCYLQLFSNSKEAKEFITKIGIYVNGVYVVDANYFYGVNDVLQIYSSEALYSYILRKKKKNKVYFSKIKPRIFKLIRNKIDPHKQSTKNIPKYVNIFNEYKFSQPLNIEFDYNFMAFICLYSNNNNYKSNFQKYDYFSLYLKRLYNWKYIV